MMIELMVRWTEMRIKPNDDNDAKLKKLLDGESQPAFTPDFYTQIAPMVFEMNDVARYNKSQDKKSTTVRMKDGDIFIVEVGFDDFKNLYTECTGKAIVIVKNSDGSGHTPTPGMSGSDFDIDNI
jgi:cell division septal protein FtsQ